MVLFNLQATVTTCMKTSKSSLRTVVYFLWSFILDQLWVHFACKLHGKCNTRDWSKRTLHTFEGVSPLSSLFFTYCHWIKPTTTLQVKHPTFYTIRKINEISDDEMTKLWGNKESKCNCRDDCLLQTMAYAYNIVKQSRYYLQDSWRHISSNRVTYWHDFVPLPSLGSWHNFWMAPKVSMTSGNIKFLLTDNLIPRLWFPCTGRKWMGKGSKQPLSEMNH